MVAGPGGREKDVLGWISPRGAAVRLQLGWELHRYEPLLQLWCWSQLMVQALTSNPSFHLPTLFVCFYTSSLLYYIFCCFVCNLLNIFSPHAYDINNHRYWERPCKQSYYLLVNRENDTGVLSYKEHLPVTEILVGDTNRTGSEAIYRVGSLHCYGDST